MNNLLYITVMWTIVKKYRYVVLFFLLANVYFLLSQIPFFIFILKTPSTAFYPFYHQNNLFDYNFYLSAITQGTHGAWLLHDSLTTEHTNPSTFYIFYVWVGKLLGPFFTPHTIYHIVRVIGVECLFAAIYMVGSKIFKNPAHVLLASSISIAATIAPPFLFNEPSAYINYTPWWASLESFKRLDAMPHYLFGFSLLISTMVLLSRVTTHPTLRYTTLAVISAFLGGLIFPPSTIPIIFSISFLLSSSVFQLLKKKHVQTQSLLPLLLVIGAALLAVSIIWRENSNGFPWNTWNNWEIESYNQIPQFYHGLFLVFGILPFLAIPASISFLQKGTFLEKMIVLWAYVPFILIWSADVIHLSRYRFLTIAPFVPFGILTAKSILMIQKPKLQIVLMVFFLTSAIPVSGWHLFKDARLAMQFPLFPVLYISMSHWQTIDFIKTHLSTRSVILSDQYIGSILAAHTNNTSFIGHGVHTMHFEEKKELLGRFFGGRMNNDEAKTLFKTYGIHYVYVGPEERMYGGNVGLYTQLESIYHNQNVVLYKVR